MVETVQQLDEEGATCLGSLNDTGTHPPENEHSQNPETLQNSASMMILLLEKNAQGSVLESEETREIGHVNFSVWMYFLKAGGVCFAAAAVMGMSLFVYIQIGANFLLGQWTDDVARRMSSPVIEMGTLHSPVAEIKEVTRKQIEILYPHTLVLCFSCWFACSLAVI